MLIQLKVRTEGTFGETFAPISKIIERLKEQGCTAAAIVDSNTWLHVRWFKACKEAGIIPLLGVEVVVSDDDVATKMWFLAKNKEGLSELYRATSKSHHQPFSAKYGKLPRLFRDDVRRMSDNIFVFAGEVTDEEFLTEIRAVVDFNPASKVLNMKKRNVAEKHGLRSVETSDNSYARESDKQAFELMTSRQTKPTPQHLLDIEPTDVMRAIVDECKDLELPVAPMIHMAGDLEALCRAGIEFRKMAWNDVYEKRLVHELKMIAEKNFESYFLVVADMVQYAKEHMLVGPSRGSSAGSLVCFLTRITEIDPIPPKLFFERFIDTTRSDLPDIDLDFPDDKRHLVFEYMAKKYGVDNVAHIGTISTFKPKSALIQVCKALGIPPSATGAVKVAMIERSSADARASNCLEDTFNTTAAGKAFIAAYPQAVLSYELEGHASHTGVHAAGLLICNDRIDNYATVDADNIAHVEKNAAEHLGLLKIDVLGLRTLGILEDSGVKIDWYNLPLNDQKTFDVFNNQRLCGIFQFEGNAMRSISELLSFESITEIDAVTALARPGPFAGGVTKEYLERKSGKDYKAIHPVVEPHMRETYGLPVYQEQTLSIVREIGKFDWTETSTIRKAMSKRLGNEFFETYWEKFKKGAASQGISEDEARATWELINSMGSWQMNKAHTYSYAVISYWCAYLKAHHPLEFAAANLRSAKDEESAVQLLREICAEGIEYVAFDLDKSSLNWSVVDGKLYGGFTSLKGIGDSKAQKLIDARNAGKLTQKQRDEISKAENIFLDLFPLTTKYGHIYDDPDANGIVGSVSKIDQLTEGMPHGEERVFIAELVHKNSRNANEDAEIKKRGGKIETGQLEYLDLRFRDDTGLIGGRIGRWKYLQIGVDLLENVPVGAHLLVRAKFFNGIRYAFVEKWKRIDL